jgi:15-cis-phytoene synthase
MSEANEITKKSQSNLAFAFVSLPKQTRQDIITFYAFCRRVDDAADDPEVPLPDRQRWLRGWRRWLVATEDDEPGIAAEVRGLIAKYKIDLQLFEEILLGVEMDLEPVRFENFEALYRYCYRVASAVGLVSIEIFGYKNPRCKEYAQKLGVALQLTNIIRDVDRDLRNGRRIYLPLNELRMFGYSEQALLNRVYNGAFLRLMQFQAERAHSFFREAQRLLPPEDRRSMVAAEGMRAIYYALLLRIEKHRFRMFEKEYRLTRFEKGIILAGSIASNSISSSVFERLQRTGA